MVHVVYLEDNLIQNIPDSIIHSQIDALNRDFGVTNEDTVNLRPIFKPFRGYPKIKFELAKLDTSGNPTTRIFVLQVRHLLQMQFLQILWILF